MSEKDRFLQARPLGIVPGEGPTFPKLTKTSPFHMLIHDGPVPKADALEGVYHRINVASIDGAQHNPTVWVDGAGVLRGVIRVLNGPKTTNYVGRIAEDFTLVDAVKMTTREPAGSLEDLRVFMWNGAPWAIAATHNGAVPPVAIRQALLELSEDASDVLRVHTQPAVRHEKNWMPCVEASTLRLVYSLDPLVVLDVEGRRASPNAALIPQATSHLRGGTQLVAWEDGFLALIHQVHRPPRIDPGHNALLSSFWAPPIKDPVSGDAPVVYLHRFAKFNGALTSFVLSKAFYFRKPGIEFCAGLAHWGEGLVAAFGAADCEAWLVEIARATVDTMFEVTP